MESPLFFNDEKKIGTPHTVTSRFFFGESGNGMTFFPFFFLNSEAPRYSLLLLLLFVVFFF